MIGNRPVEKSVFTVYLDEQVVEGYGCHTIDDDGPAWCILKDGENFCFFIGADDDTAVLAKRTCQLLNTFWDPRRIM